ncbi:RecQ family ATP-dependent DNA helicase [Flavobacteriaceae bacterium F08102]|nr:RecQ family ATP-dependent DNA helicase [Flavobacteriaceae bacterium F08102]
MNKKALQILQKYWHYNAFKAPQEEVITSVLNKQDTIVIMPTGGGKSLCYQVPAMVNPGVCLVISPLLALMDDQVNHLQSKGIKAIAITSALNQEEIIQAFDNLQFGNYKFLYLSPEKLQSDFIQQKLRQLQINLIAVDEAHCISEWGHDFRPAYLKIHLLRALDITAPIIALTATATKSVIEDIHKQLALNNAVLIQKSLQRPNIDLKIIHTDNVYPQLKALINKKKEPAIIYASSRNRVKNYSDYLNQHGFESVYYHGGLPKEDKNKAFDQWMSERKPIMVATNAFGMGIDKDNVRQVFHLDIPQSLENYMQESGRAGRDGAKATAYLFVNDHLIENLKTQYKRGAVTVDAVKKVYTSLNQYLYISYGSQPDQKFEFNLTEFCARFKLVIPQTYNALKVLEKEGVLVFEEGFNKNSSIKIMGRPSQILAINKNQKNALLTLLLRTYGGIFENYVPINETFLASRLHVKPQELRQMLIKLNTHEWIDYHPQRTVSHLQFLMPREDNYTINRIRRNIKHRLQISKDKLTAMINFVQHTEHCRNQRLLAYFGETLKKPCGNCDLCRSKKTITSSRISQKELAVNILELLKKKPMSVEELVANLNDDKATIISQLRQLLDDQKITLNLHQKLTLRTHD